MTIRPVPILSGYLTSNMTSPYVSPEMPRDLVDATVIVTVEQVNGSPTTATISPKFQIWHSHVGGHQDEVILGGAGASPYDTWFDITAAANPNTLPDGDWPSSFDVSTATLAAPKSVFRTIRGGFPWRLVIPWALAGGTTPSLRISAMAYCRERFIGGFDRVESSA